MIALAQHVGDEERGDEEDGHAQSSQVAFMVVGAAHRDEFRGEEDAVVVLATCPRRGGRIRNLLIVAWPFYRHTPLERDVLGL